MQIYWHFLKGVVRRGPELARRITAVGFLSHDSVALSGTQPRKEGETDLEVASVQRSISEAPGALLFLAPLTHHLLAHQSLLSGGIPRAMRMA